MYSDMELRKGLQPRETALKVISGGWEKRRCWITKDRFWASLAEKMIIMSCGAVNLKALIWAFERTDYNLKYINSQEVKKQAWRLAILFQAYLWKIPERKR